MSGFVAPARFGPWELYDCKTPFCQQTAPTASTAGEVAGSIRLPDETTYSSGLEPT
jgi:hypothetical protein